MATHARQMYVNVPVRDLERSKQFFGELGFEFNTQFTDANAAAMIVGSDAFVMLLTEPFFKTFTKKQLCDTRSESEEIIALSCESRAEVDELVERAVDAGGKDTREIQEHGVMYGRGFYDPDGHQWQVLWMDPSVVVAQSTSQVAPDA
jgi:predicted lactoylglutathione lyase